MSNQLPLSNQLFTFTQTLGGWARSSAPTTRMEIYNIGTLGRELITRVHTFAQGILGQQLGTAATMIIVAVALFTTFYCIYKAINIIRSCCRPRERQDDDDWKDNDEKNNNNNSNNNNTAPPTPLEIEDFENWAKIKKYTKNIDENKKENNLNKNNNFGIYNGLDFVEEHYIEESSLEIDIEKSSIKIDPTKEPDFKKWIDLQDKNQKIQTVADGIAHALKNLNTLKENEFKTFQERLPKYILIRNKFQNDLSVKEGTGYKALCNQLDQIKNGLENSKNAVKTDYMEWMKKNPVEATQIASSSKIKLVCITSATQEAINTSIANRCGRYLKLLYTMKKAEGSSEFEIAKKIEEAKRELIISIVDPNIQKFLSGVDYVVFDQTKYDKETKILEDMKFPNIDNLVNAKEDEFKDYQSFHKLLVGEIKKEGSKPSPFISKNLKKHFDNAEALFKNTMDSKAFKNTLTTLQKELKKNFKETPVVDKENGTVTCSAEMMLFAFGLVKKDPHFQRLASVAFNHEGRGINQKALYTRAVQIVLCGFEPFKNVSIPNSSYAFKVKEIEDQKILPKEDSEMTKDANSYSFTQLNASEQEQTIERKFKLIADQYIKDFCLTRGSYEVTFNNQLPFSIFPIHVTIKNNEKLKRDYTDYLKKQTKESLTQLIKDAKDSSLVKAALNTFPSEEKDLNTSEFPITVLEKMFAQYLDNDLVKNTLSSSSLNAEDLEEITKSSGLDKKALEPLLRYKVLEHLCFRSQSSAIPVNVYVSNLNKGNVFPFHYETNSFRRLNIEDQSCNTATYTLKADFFELNESSNPIYYATTMVTQKIENINKDSKVTYSVINDFRVSHDINQDAMTFWISQTDPTYLEKMRIKEMTSLQTFDDVKGGGTLIVDDKGNLKAKDSEKTFTWLTGGLFADYKQPDLNTLTAINASFQHLLTTYQLWNQILSKEEKVKAVDEHAIRCQGTINNAISKLANMISDQDDKNVQKQLRLIQTNYEALNELLSQWQALTIDPKLEKQENSTDQTQEFLAQIDEEKVKSLSEEQAPSYIQKAYEIYTKKLIPSDKPEDFMWKTAKYDTIIFNIQDYITQKYFGLGISFMTGSKLQLEKLSSIESPVGKALLKTLEELSQIKVDPNKRPSDHQTLGYQKRIRTLYQNFFIALDNAAKEALDFKANLKKDENISEDIEYANMILEICHQMVTGANLKDVYIDTIKTFYPEIDNIKGKGLCTVIEEAYEAIKNADSCRKTPVQDGAFKSLKGHFNVAFNGWFAGNPVSQWLKMTFGKQTIDLLAFGSPTNESSPSFATVLNIFKALMKSYEENNQAHMYVSVQNLIPVDAQGWKKWFKILPDWLNGWCQTIVGGDETNRSQALMKLEDEYESFYFMNLSMNSQFYKHPVELVESKDLRDPVTKKPVMIDLLENPDRFKKRLIEELFDKDSKISGNYISKKTRDAYKKKTGVDIRDWAVKAADKIHKTLFTVEGGEFDGTPLNKLTEEERECFIEYFYDVLTSEIAQKLGVKSMNESCKDDIDRGIVRSANKFITNGIANGLGDDEQFKKDSAVIVNSRATQTRQREIIDERYERIQLLTKYSLTKQKALKKMFDELWPNTAIKMDFA